VLRTVVFVVGCTVRWETHYEPFFFSALHNRTKRLDRILIESDSINSDQLAHTLKHTPFLGQRYEHQLTFRIVDMSQLFEAGVDSLKALDPIHSRSQQYLVVVDRGPSLRSASLAVPLSCIQRKVWSDLIEATLPYKKVLFVNMTSTAGSEADEGPLSVLARLSKDLCQCIETK
jgi:hypothetical protein